MKNLLNKCKRFYEFIHNDQIIDSVNKRRCYFKRLFRIRTGIDTLMQD